MISLVPWAENEDYVPLFEDLSKAFYSVDHELLLNKLRDVGFGPKAVKCFTNYYEDQTQCVYADPLF